jgi:hypothetical protein
MEILLGTNAELNWIELNLLNYLIEILSFFFVFYKLSLNITKIFFFHTGNCSRIISKIWHLNSSRFRPCLTLGGNALNILSPLCQIMLCVFVFWYRGSLKSSALRSVLVVAMYSEFFPWNNSDIFLDFFARNFSCGKKIKFLRKDFNPSYLRIGRWS